MVYTIPSTSLHVYTLLIAFEVWTLTETDEDYITTPNDISCESLSA